MNNCELMAKSISVVQDVFKGNLDKCPCIKAFNEAHKGKDKTEVDKDRYIRGLANAILVDAKKRRG